MIDSEYDNFESESEGSEEDFDWVPEENHRDKVGEARKIINGTRKLAENITKATQRLINSVCGYRLYPFV